MNIITGYRGEAHITSAQDRAKNQGAFGTGSYILDVGDELAAEIVSANEVRIRDGVLCMQGCVANIEEGAYDSCEISNGTQGMQRRDLIVARYTKDAETNIEDISLVVIEGTPVSSNPSDPAYNSGNIQAGDSPVDFPLYRVSISGITISSTTKLASNIRTQAEADTLLTAINEKTTIKYGNVTAASGFTVDEPNIKQFGNVVFVKFYVSKSSTIGTSEVNIATVSGVTLPPSNIRFTCSSGVHAYDTTYSAYGYFGTDGKISVLLSQGASQVVVVCVTYIAET